MNRTALLALSLLFVDCLSLGIEMNAPVVHDSGRLDFMIQSRIRKLRQLETRLTARQVQLASDAELDSQESALASLRAQLDSDAAAFAAAKSKFADDKTNFESSRELLKLDRADLSNKRVKLGDDEALLKSSQAELNLFKTQLDAARARLAGDSANLQAQLAKLNMNRAELGGWMDQLKTDLAALALSQKQVQFMLEQLASDRANHSIKLSQFEKQDALFVEQWAKLQTALKELNQEHELWLQKKADWEAAWNVRKAEWARQVTEWNAKVQQWTIRLNSFESGILAKEAQLGQITAQNKNLLVEVNVFRTENKGIVMQISELQKAIAQLVGGGNQQFLVGSAYKI